MKLHLTARYRKVSDKNEQYFQRQLTLIKRQTATFAKKFKVSDKVQEASYAMAEIIAKKTKSHAIAKTVILHARQEMARIMFGEDTVSDINKIPLSDNKISKRIADMSSDSERNVPSKVNGRELFAFQVDEFTEISGKALILHLFVLLTMKLWWRNFCAAKSC